MALEMVIGIDMRNSFFIFLLFLFGLLQISCSDADINKRVLFSDFVSNQDINSFENKYPDFKRIQNSMVKSGKFQLVQYRNNSYEFSKLSDGVLIASFLNDRLMQMLYYPYDCNNHDKLFSNFKSIDKNIEFTYGVDYQGSCYASWADKKLQNKFDYFVQ